jgi:hypothetical protein
MLLRALAQLLSDDLAVDVGTANTLVYVRGQGIALNEPSVVAISHQDHSLLAVGEEAKAMLGQAPGSIGAVRPRDRRLRCHGEDAELLHPEGPSPSEPGPSAHRPLRNHAGGTACGAERRATAPGASARRTGIALGLNSVTLI